MVRDEDQALGGEHEVIYTDVQSECCTPKTDIILYTNIIKDRKEEERKKKKSGIWTEYVKVNRILKSRKYKKYNSRIWVVNKRTLTNLGRKGTY